LDVTIEGSKRGYLARTQWSMQRNRATINRMRKENLQLHKAVVDALEVSFSTHLKQKREVWDCNSASDDTNWPK